MTCDVEKKKKEKKKEEKKKEKENKMTPAPTPRFPDTRRFVSPAALQCNLVCCFSRLSSLTFRLLVVLSVPLYHDELCLFVACLLGFLFCLSLSLLYHICRHITIKYSKNKAKKRKSTEIHLQNQINELYKKAEKQPNNKQVT